MCGIAGIVAPEVSRYRNSLERMVRTLDHRGPDGSGTHLYQNCGLGHSRLAIVDLETGQQPMLSSDGSFAVTFNGEIYGYRDIRARFATYPFRTSSDTEVILALYERYGPDMLRHLPGMFAFAIWDDDKQQLFCARDRFGEKPLYYALTSSGAFVFGSELKAILASGLVTPRIGSNELERYLRRGYAYPDGSIYSNIKSVPPAHYVSFCQGEVTVKPYWQLPATKPNVSLAEAAGRLRDLFTRAVTRQLVADVPVGAFLSGGLDSSTVVGAAKQLEPGLKTFSFDFLDEHSEIEYARAVAEQLSTDHTELRSDATTTAELLLRIQSVYDEPFYDSSSIPTFLLCSLASEHTKVALTGDGADELFGGYTWYRNYPFTEQRPRFLFWKWTAARVAARMSRVLGLRSYAVHESRNIRLSLQHRFPTVLAAHQRTMSIIPDEHLHKLGIAPQGQQRVTEANYQDNDLDAALRNDLTDYMPADILVKTDRAAMANSLELRAPFLDIDLAEYCISLPPELKVTSDADKVVLRESYSQVWPVEVRNRAKQGFGAPLQRWLAQPDMSELKSDLLHDRQSPLYDHCDYAGTINFLRTAAPIQVWLLLTLAAWLHTPALHPVSTVVD